jgi:hypothetical protein
MSFSIRFGVPTASPTWVLPRYSTCSESLKCYWWSGEVKSFKMKTKDGLIDVGKLFAKVRALSSSRELCAVSSARNEANLERSRSGRTGTSPPLVMLRRR